MSYKSKIAILGAVAFATVCAVVLSVPSAEANPSYFLRCSVTGCPQQALATSTPVYMTAGAATTTIQFDTGRGTAQGSDSAVLLTQFTASSTSSKLQIAFQYSQDGVDWYDSNLNNQATTTATQDISVTQNFLWSAAASGRLLKAVVVNVPTKYVRALISVPVGAANGAVWAEFVAKQQAGQ